MPAGRPRTPTAKLKLHGDYRSDRHGDRAAEPKPSGKPVKPAGMAKDAAAHWDAVVPGLVATGVATAADAPALAAMCQWHAEYLTAKRKTVKDRKRLMMMVSAHREWMQLASKFGLTPVDRARIQVGEAEESDPAAEFIA